MRSRARGAEPGGPGPSRLRAHLRAGLRLVEEERLARSRSSFLGRWWGVALPAAESLVFTALFGALLLIRGSPAEYLPFVFTGLLAWRVTARAVTGAAGALSRRAPLLRSFPVPGAVVVLAVVADAFVAGLAGLPVLVVIVLLTAGPPTLGAAAVWLPLGGLLHVLTTVAAALVAALAATFFRDVRRAVPALLGGLMFLSPVVYPSALVPPPLRIAYLMNPVAGALESYRAGLLGDPGPSGVALAGGFALALALLALGSALFLRLDTRLREVL